MKYYECFISFFYGALQNATGTLIASTALAIIGTIAHKIRKDRLDQR